MKLRSITLEGFQFYKHRETVDLQGLNLTAIVGQNRAGKSTLITNAIMFAFYGASRTDTLGEVISRGESRAEVTVEFDLGDSAYRIIRSRTRKGTPEVSVAVADPSQEGGWKALNEKTPKTTDQFIVELLGMNATVAEMTWMILQGKAGVFCEMPPSKRRDALSEAFGLERFAELANTAKKRRDAAQPALEKAQADVANLTARIEQWSQPGPHPEMDDPALERAATDAEAAVAAAAAALAEIDDDALAARAATTARALSLFDTAHASALAEHDAHRQRLQAAETAAQRELARARQDYSQAFDASLEVDAHEEAHQVSVAAVTSAEAEVETARAQISQAEASASAAAAEVTALSGQAAEINEQLKTLTVSVQKGEGLCFTCHQSLTPDHARELVAAQEAHKATLHRLYDAKKREAQQAQSEAQQGRHALRALEQAVAAARRAERDAEAQWVKTRQLAGGEDAAAAAERAAATAHTSARDAREAIGAAPVCDEAHRAELAAAARRASAAVESARSNSAARRGQLGEQRDAARQRSRDLWQESNRRRMAAEELTSLVRPLEKARAAAAKHSKDHVHYSAIHEAYKPSGIPFMILSGIVQEINEEANDILADLGDDGMGVQISTGADSKRGSRTSEQVLINVLQADGVASYASLSGSEQLRVAVAVRMAMAACIARRSGTPMETVIMDEGWGALDGQYKKALMEMLSRLAKRFAVFTVSHIADVSELFPSLIEVSRAEGTSRTQVTRAAA